MPKPHERKILLDHKFEKGKLIPPFLQIPQLTETDFITECAPCLIWLSAFFLRGSDKNAIDLALELTKALESEDENRPMAFLQNIKLASDATKSDALSKLSASGSLQEIKQLLIHQHRLLKDYPLSFLFAGEDEAYNREEEVEKLMQDVEPLLNKRGHHTTKVQVTAVFSMLVNGNLKCCVGAEPPDFNAIFNDPDSEEAKLAASFARCNINITAGTLSAKDSDHWKDSFWKQAFALEGCL